MQGKSVGPNSAIVKAVEHGIIGGVLLFEYNISPTKSQATLQKLTTDLQNASNIPLLISIDQEGGQVNRLKTKYGFPAMPSAKSVGDKNDDAYTVQVANTIAQTLVSCGININFAPTLDVHNPLCPVLGKRNRCFSANPATIASIAEQYVQTHREQGVRTCLKHFPGHGNSRTDSHLGLTDVTKYWTDKELIPYKTLIENNMVDAIMSGHITNKRLDASGLPATLSKVIITGLLRNTLGYKGVVFSDDMQMHAISSNYGFEESIKMAINAGVDVLIFSNNISGATDYTPQNIHATIKKLVLNKQISMQRINESYERILNLKNKTNGGR